MSVALRERVRGSVGAEITSVDDLGDADSLNLWLVDPQGYGLLLEAEKTFEHMAACTLSVAECYATNGVPCDPECARDGNWRLDARRLPVTTARFHADVQDDGTPVVPYVLVVALQPRREVVAWGDLPITPATLPRLKEVQRRTLEAVTFAAFANTRAGSGGADTP